MAQPVAYYRAQLAQLGDYTRGNRYVLRRRLAYYLLQHVVPLLVEHLPSRELRVLGCVCPALRLVINQVARLQMPCISPLSLWLSHRSLRILIQHDKQRWELLLNEPLVVGRHWTRFISDTTVSRKHLVLTHKSGLVWVQVLGRHGIYMGRPRVHHGVNSELYVDVGESLWFPQMQGYCLTVLG